MTHSQKVTTRIAPDINNNNDYNRDKGRRTRQIVVMNDRTKRPWLFLFLTMMRSPTQSSSFLFIPAPFATTQCKKNVPFNIPSTTSLLDSSSSSQKYQEQEPSDDHYHEFKRSIPNDTKATTSHVRVQPTKMIPQHVAFICDGNSRWAHRRGLHTREGHVQGADRLLDLLEQLQHDQIRYCTLYGFSTENWKRPKEEIQEIFGVMEATARTIFPRLLQKNRIGSSSYIRIRILGDLHDERIPLGLRMILQELQRTTDQQQHQGGAGDILTVCLAINYGGRQDIVQATQKMVAAVQAGTLSLEDIDNDSTFSSYLSTAGIPDPDLIVRTSGEHRLSNFLLWNSAYSEFYVTETLWPDFDIQAWHAALEWYQHRNRRFGSREPVAIHPNGTVNNTSTTMKNIAP